MGPQQGSQGDQRGLPGFLELLGPNRWGQNLKLQLYTGLFQLQQLGWLAFFMHVYCSVLRVRWSARWWPLLLGVALAPMPYNLFLGWTPAVATGWLVLCTLAGCTEETLKQVLYPLQLACASNMQVRCACILVGPSCSHILGPSC